jgi:hypothetical protein
LDVQTAIDEALERRIDWIVHIDVDEAFYSPHCPVREHFSHLQRLGLGQALYLNHEAAPEQMEIGDYFREVTLFKKSPYLLLPVETRSGLWQRRSYFVAYDNGKAAARIRPGLQPLGVHRFRHADEELVSTTWAEPAVLHYVNCGLQRFEEKYRLLGGFSDNYVDGGKRLSFHVKSRDAYLAGKMRDLYAEQILVDLAAARSEQRKRQLMRIDRVSSLVGR